MITKLWDVHFFLDILSPCAGARGAQVYHLFDDEIEARRFAGRRGIVQNRVWGEEFTKGRGIRDHRSVK